MVFARATPPPAGRRWSRWIRCVSAVFCALTSLGCGDAATEHNAADAAVTPVGAPLGRLRVKDGRLVDAAGDQVVLEGLGLGALDYVKASGHWQEAYFVNARAWHAAVVRLPIDPVAYRTDPTQALADIDQAVKWCKRSNLYLIIEYHVIGNVEQGLFLYGQDTAATWQDVKDFWDSVAPRYASEPTVAFYEIYNEPSAVDFEGGTWTFADWKLKADELVTRVRERAPDTIPLVAGFDFAFDFSAGGQTPFASKDIALSVHPYAGKTRTDAAAVWDSAFGYLAGRYPIVFTEVGFDPYDLIVPASYRADLPYGREVIAYARDKQISWTAFVFYLDPIWPMPLFSEWTSLTPTVSGAFFKDLLAGVELSVAGDGFGPRPPVVNPPANGPAGLYWSKWAQADATADWTLPPSSSSVAIHVDAAPTVQGGMSASFQYDGTLVDTSVYNEAAFDGTVPAGQSFAFALGRTVTGVYYGCSWNLVGKGSATYLVDLLNPAWCGPSSCFDMQADGVSFMNAWSEAASSADIELGSFALRTNTAKPLPTGGQIGTSACR
jgi:endoglucanase